MKSNDCMPSQTEERACLPEALAKQATPTRALADSVRGRSARHLEDARPQAHKTRPTCLLVSWHRARGGRSPHIHPTAAPELPGAEDPHASPKVWWTRAARRRVDKGATQGSRRHLVGSVLPGDPGLASPKGLEAAWWGGV